MIMATVWLHDDVITVADCEGTRRHAVTVESDVEGQVVIHHGSVVLHTHVQQCSRGDATADGLHDGVRRCEQGLDGTVDARRHHLGTPCITVTQSINHDARSEARHTFPITRETFESDTRCQARHTAKHEHTPSSAATRATHRGMKINIQKRDLDETATIATHMVSEGSPRWQ